MPDLGIETKDVTPAYAVISSGGLDIAPGDEVQVVAEAPGRSRIILARTGGTGVVWLALDQTAQDGVGLPLGPGGSINEPLWQEIRAINTGDDTAHLSWWELGV